MKPTGKKKKKFLLSCFQPIKVIMENRAPVENRESGSNLNKIYPYDALFLKFNKFSSDKEEKNCSSNMKIVRRVLKNIAKVAFFNTNSLCKKGRNGKFIQDPWKSDGINSTKNEKSSVKTVEKWNRKQIEEDRWKKIKETISSSYFSSSTTLTSSSSFSSSSSISSSISSYCSSSSRPPVSETRSSWITFSEIDKSFRLNSSNNQDHKKQSKNKINPNYSYKTGLILLIFSLIVLIFCGKICSIICTSTWFYWVSTYRRISEEDESMVMEKSKEETAESKINGRTTIINSSINDNFLR